MNSSAEKLTQLISILPESYTLETAASLLKRQGVNLRHQDLAAELSTASSTYKRLLQLPALIIYNQTLIDHANNANEYLQEQLINIIFAVNEVRANHPNIKNPLSDHRLDEYEKIQTTTDATSEQLIQLETVHHKIQDQVYNQLKAQLAEWQSLCQEAAEKLTQSLIQQGLDVPNNFSIVLTKHLERVGTNQINEDELKNFKPDGRVSYTEKAIICALKEVGLYG